MPSCPECKRTLGETELVCPECKRDFRCLGAPPKREGIAYSTAAEVALVVGQVVAALGCAVALFACALAFVQGRWVDALLAGPLGFFLLLAQLVVLMRAQDMVRET